ncbi:Hypothetical predicted protein [Lecanosticta acicola]|uniref:Uncharacterized protein n=1 Tax=Lecanosticta acicola TaxID=111012 RepID=A0AAI9E749_9PEZI|nr:Hypothetical predicted protein [Lecanosticta acicola]
MSDPQQNNADATSQPAWNAVQYEAALAHLYKLQEQIESLRDAIPSVVRPLTRPITNKPQAYAQIKKAAVGATDELNAFRENWMSEKTQSLLVRSKESYEKDDDLGKANQVARWGWEDYVPAEDVRDEGKK